MATSTLAAVPHFPTGPTLKSHDQNAAILLNPWRIGEQLDPLTIAPSGFPEVNSYRACYEGAVNEDN